jgi:hypothetical protein
MAFIAFIAFMAFMGAMMSATREELRNECEERIGCARLEPKWQQSK